MTNFSDKQLEFLKSTHSRLNILHGAVRSGKTHVLYYTTIWLAEQFKDKLGKGFIIAKTLETLRNNILDPMQELFGLRYSDSGRRISLNGIDIRGVGANDERSHQKIQGATASWAIGDEISLWPESFFKMILSRLSTSGAMLFGSCNPDSPYHYLKKDFIDNPKLDISTTHWTIDDNTFLGQEYVENLKTEYTGVWHKRYIAGLWVAAEGSIYDMFDESIHVVEPVAYNLKNACVGVDYGTNNPCVFILLKWNDNSKVYATDEFYYDSNKAGRQLTDGEYAEKMELFFSENKLIKQFTPVHVDPSASSLILELRRNGFMVSLAENDVLPGIRRLATAFSKSMLFVYKNCINLKEQTAGYAWDMRAQQRGIDQPVKRNDHATDALRYAYCTQFSQSGIMPVVRSR